MTRKPRLAVGLYSAALFVFTVLLIAPKQSDAAEMNARGADINHVHITGQSLAGGYATTDYSPLSINQPFTNLMFKGSLYGHDYSGFSPLREVFLETPASGMANTVSSLIASEVADMSPADHPLLMSLAAKGNTSLLELDWYGGDPHYVFWSGMYNVWAARQVALAGQKSYRMQGVMWFQGETDIYLGTSAWVYMTRLLKMQWDYNQYFRMFAGQWDSVPLFTYQTSSHQYFGKSATIAQAQLLASEWSPDVHLVTPIYHLPYSDALHLTNHGYRWMGAYFGKVYKKVIVEGQVWKPLSPTDIYATDNRHVVVDFHVPEPPLVLDTESVSDPGDYGFEVVDAAGVVPLESVTLTGDAQVALVTQRPMQGETVLRYAYTGTPGVVSGPASGARGNLRDSDATVGYGQNADDAPYPLWNWCVIFEKPIDRL